MTAILRIDASARNSGSISRDLTDRIVAKLSAEADATVTTRDLASGLPQVDSDWIAANFTPADQRNDAQKATLALSDSLVAEVQAADVLVIGLPIYNFGVPSTLKAWIDMIARAGVTFRYTEKGPVGLLEGKRAIVAVASGGTKMGSEMDFATGYIRHVMGFIGITQVDFVAADQLMIDAEATMKSALAQVGALAA
ncbi:MAG: NAD(P)H-dependent oxidoreductase [Pseudorhodobacter sp.]|nr:NAD(P)H-dependent oxidoreductase [Pseudorhodobacter sp.]